MNFFQRMERKYLLSPKILFFVVNMQFYTLHLMRGPFLKQQFGFSDKTYGRNVGIILALAFFGTLFIASLNDRFNRPKVFIISLILISTVFFQILCLNFTKKLATFIIWCIFTFYTLFASSIQPFLDKTTLDIINSFGGLGLEVYGRQRLFGTLGYVVTNYIVEFISASSTSSKKDYSNLPKYQLFTTALAVVVAITFINIQPTRTTVSTRQLSGEWKSLLTNIPYMFFILIIFLNGITRAGMTLYLTIYLQDVLKLKPLGLPNWMPNFLAYPINFFSHQTVATAALFGVVFEILVFFFSKKVLKTIGLFWPLLIAQVAQLIRFMGYYFLPVDSDYAYGLVCLLETMKGVNFGFTHTSGVQIANSFCPDHLRSTSQMIYSGTFVGLATAISGFLFGMVFSSKDLKDKNMPREKKIGQFKNFFFINIGLTLFTILLFVIKYGAIDGILWKVFTKEEKKETDKVIIEEDAESIPINK
ncbi:Permease of the major facilitator superfamily [Spraguea lophii 42_110]|uniref:Permease of the major facilitator superfamily n=1 Tax=Spraguea lophii (strain 42_110) TaxID=1358809 RepID=S7XW53_SPRLO|nr:Permease of the major facilitator superfamily [Spraguea lophii 42_110]